jgi:macrolide transport system ATP-binding/permease protein
MATLREWIGRLWGTLWRTRADRDLEEELQLHLELAAEDARRRGDSPERAARAARLRAGNIQHALEALRDQRGLPWLEHLARDLRYGWRMLRRNRGFTIVAVVSLAVGIGANSAVFSFADALLLRPLPVPHPGDVLTVGSTASVEGFSSLVASYPEYVDIRDRNRSFDGLAGFTGLTFAFAPDAVMPPMLRFGMLVSGNFFTAMRVEPQLGRTFRPDEDVVPGRDAVVVLGYDAWVQHFGMDRSVVGRTLRLNEVEFTVVGVAPPSFTGLYQFARVDFYVPLMMWPRLVPDPNARPLEARGVRPLTIKGRLKPGVSMSEAQTELAVIARGLELAYPDTNRNRYLTVRTELQARMAQDRTDAVVIAMLTTLAAVVLFVACANVASLLTSRAPVRAREMALRLAIGAGRRRLIQQLMIENLLIAAIGGLLGVGVAYAGVRVFRLIQLPTDLPLAITFELGRRSLEFSLVVALVSAVLFGLAPAIQATRANLTAVMKATDTLGFGRRRWGRAVLVGGQVAASVVLLVIATFMYRNFQRQLGTGPGYRTDHLLMMTFEPTLVRYTESQAQQFLEQVAERVRQVPGVRSVALGSSVPMDTDPSVFAILPERFELPPGKDNVAVLGSTVDEYYFDTIGVPILEGRGFRMTDSAEAPRVAVVNEQIARHYWPNQDPIGKRFRLNDERGPWVEIVGLAKIAKYTFLAERPTEFLYLPLRQHPQSRMILLAESSGDSASLAAPLRALVRSLDASQPIYNVRTMEDFYRMRVVTAFNVVIGSVAAMGLMGLGLSIVGLYGLVAYAVSRRTKEIGVRMAIGAGQSTVLQMVLGQGMKLALAGLGLGLVASVGARRLLAAAFGNTARDLDFVPLLLVAVLVLVVTLVATYVPARRASQVNPIEALRCE